MKHLIPRFILEKNKENKFSGNFKATTMFIDISGFTSMTQELMKNGKEGAEILSEIINKIYTPAIKAVYDHNGFITTFAGDAFTSVFPYKDSKQMFTINAATIIQDIFDKIGKQKTKFGEFDLSIKVGLSYGTVNWGIIKGDKLKSYYFKGSAVDNCAVSEHNAKKGEIIFDIAVLHKIQNKVAFEKKSKSHFLLKSILKANKQKLVKKSTKQLPQTDFISESILKLKSKGEFRDIISCFISFEESKNWKQAISKIIELTNIYGGYFNKIDFGDKGGNILVLFGAPIGKEKIFSRACDFALAVRNLPNFQILANFKARIGLTYGTSFAGFVGSKVRAEYTALGMVVNLSARFMMKANPNEIYIDKFINKSIYNRYEINELKEQQFKGFKEKIPVYLLAKKKEYKTIFEGKLIGRQKELQKLKKSLTPIKNGKFGGIVYVHGIAGIGKSRLVNELKEKLTPQMPLSKRGEFSFSHFDKGKVRGSFVSWFYLPCDEILQKSFNPFTRFLKDYFEQSEENTKQINISNLENKLENIIKQTKDKEIKNELIRTKSIFGAMVNLFWKNSLYEQLDAKGRYENTLYAIKNLIKAKSLQNPVIIELEDGHWIDSDSKKFLEILTRNVSKYPFIIISACRYNDGGSLFNFDLKEVSEQSIELEHLDKTGSQRLIENKLKGKVAEEVLDLIWQKSEGNPFYIEQIILYLQENKLIDKNLNLTKKDFEIPKTINSIIIARIDRLTAELKELVQTASVLGREFAVNILSAMLENKEIQQELNEGERENIWNTLTEINFIFKHALIRESVYQMQLKQRLKTLHKLAAVTIENINKRDLKKVYEELANHYEKAEVTEKAIEYLEKAGDYAKENYKNELAIGFYNRLLKNELWELEIEKRIDMLHKKCGILHLIGKWKESEIILNEALQLSEKIKDKKRIGKSNGNFGVQFWYTGNYDKAIKYHKKFLKISEELDDKKGISSAMGGIGLVYWNKGDYNKAMEYYDKWLLLSEELGDKRGILRVVGNMGNIHTMRGDFDKAIESHERQFKVSEELRDERGISASLVNMGTVYIYKGNYDKAMEYFQNGLKISEELGDKIGISVLLGNMGSIFLMKGDYNKGMEFYREKLKISEELGDKRGISQAFSNMGLVYFQKSNYNKAMEYYKKFLKISEELDDKAGISQAEGKIGVIYLEKGDYDKAMECYKKALKISEELGDRNGIIFTMGNMGSIFSGKSEYHKAMDCYDKAILIGKEIGIKYYLSYHLCDKSELLFLLNRFDEAKIFNEEGQQIAKEIGEKTNIFRGKVLSVKIDFTIAKNRSSQNSAVSKLQEMLSKTEDDEEKATLNYELAIMNYELGRKEIAEKHKKKAIRLYKKLYKKTPKIDYKNKIEELEKLLFDKWNS